MCSQASLKIDYFWKTDLLFILKKCDCLQNRLVKMLLKRALKVTLSSVTFSPRSFWQTDWKIIFIVIYCSLLLLEFINWEYIFIAWHKTSKRNQIWRKTHLNEKKKENLLNKRKWNPISYNMLKNVPALPVSLSAWMNLYMWKFTYLKCVGHGKRTIELG